MKIDKKLSEGIYPQKEKRFYFPQENMLYVFFVHGFRDT